MRLAEAEVEARGRVIHGEHALDDWQIAAYGPWRMPLDFTPSPRWTGPAASTTSSETS